MNKYQLLGEYLSNGGSLDEFVKETFSCHRPENDKECWHCKPCYRKFLLAKYFGYKFPKEIELKMLNYMKQKVIPIDKHEGTYFTERPSEGVYAEKAMDKFFKEYGLNWEDYK